MTQDIFLRLRSSSSAKMLIWWAGLWPNRDVVGMHFEFLSRYNIFLFKSDNRFCDCRNARRKFSSLGGELLVRQIQQVHFLTRHIPNSSSIHGKSGTCKTRNQWALSQHLPCKFWKPQLRYKNTFKNQLYEFLFLLPYLALPLVCR